MTIGVIRSGTGTFPAHFTDGRAAGQLGAGEAADASALLDAALGLWRGPALADLVEAGIDWPEIADLEELRLRVLEGWRPPARSTPRSRSS